MNCKPGDVAYVVGSPNGRNYGKVVTVIRLASVGEVLAALHAAGIAAVPGVRPPAMWLVEPSLTAQCAMTFKTAEMPYAVDDYLRPIRPGNVTDDEVRELYAPKQPEVVS